METRLKMSDVPKKKKEKKKRKKKENKPNFIHVICIYSFYVYERLEVAMDHNIPLG